MSLIERLQATIHQINGHWWNRRVRPTAPDIAEAIAQLEAMQAALRQIVEDGKSINEGNALFMARLFVDMAKRAVGGMK